MKDMKEEKMRKRRRILALFLCLTLLLSAVGSVYASADPGKVIQEDWRNFRGNSSHNAVSYTHLDVYKRQTACEL